MSKRKVHEFTDPRRTRVVERPSSPATPPKNDWQRAREQGEAARIESASRMRHELGLSTSDSEIRERARARTEEATRRAMRDAGEG